MSAAAMVRRGSPRRFRRGFGYLLLAALLAGCGSSVEPPALPAPPPASMPAYPTLTPPAAPPTSRPTAPLTSAPKKPPMPAARTLTVATFNALGSNHTAPGGSRAEWAAGVDRAGGMIDRLRAYRPDIVGVQEFQRAQVAAIRQRVGDRYGIFGNLDNSILWRRSALTVLDRTTLTIPYFGGRSRAMPVVRLRLTGTRTVVTVIDVHNPASVHGNASAFRADAVQVERAFVEQERARGRVVFLVGDFNDREEAFCPLAAGGLMTSANPGSHAGGVCTPPTTLQIDWIFGAGVEFSGYASDNTTRGDEVSDHPFVVATATLSGRRR